MAIYAKQIDFLLDGVVDDNGDVLDGGLVYVWLAGTSTLATLYQDRDKGVAQTNPVVLDSEGRGIAFVDGAVKIEVRTSADVNVWGPIDGLEYRIASGDNNFQILASDYGTTKDQTTLTAAVTAINLMSPNTRQLVLDTGDWEISSNFSFPANIVVELKKGARLDIDAGATLTFADPAPLAGSYQIFTGSGTVEFSNKVDVYLSWWDGGAANKAIYFEDAVDALSTAGGRVLVDYDCTATTQILVTTADIEFVGIGMPTLDFTSMAYQRQPGILASGTNFNYRGIIVTGTTPLIVASGSNNSNLFVKSVDFPVTSGVYSVGDLIVNPTPVEGDASHYLITASGGFTGGTRANSTAYLAGDWVVWTTGTTVWECVEAGTTGLAPPSIVGRTYGDTVSDNGVTWSYRAPTVATAVESAKLGSKLYPNVGSTSEYIEWNSGTSKLAFSHGIETASVDLGTNTIGDGTLTGNWDFNSGDFSNVGTIGSDAITSTGAVEGASLTDGTATLTSGDWTGIGSITATTLTDGTASLTGGDWTGVGSITATTFTDGTASLSGGNLSSVGTLGATSITGTTITDGVASLNAGAWTGITTINTTGNIYTQNILAYNASAGEVRQTRTGTVASDSTIGTWTGYANSTEFTTVTTHVVDATGSSESGSLRFSAITNGSPVEYMRLQDRVIASFEPHYFYESVSGNYAVSANCNSSGQLELSALNSTGSVAGELVLSGDNDATSTVCSSYKLAFHDGATPVSVIKHDAYLTDETSSSEDAEERISQMVAGSWVESLRIEQSCISLLDGISAPSATTGRALLYVDTADGDLKVRFSDGTIKTIATDT